MGSHSFCIEERITKLCHGGDNSAIWAIYNCSRSERVKGANALNQTKWLSEDDSFNGNIAYFNTFACEEGKTLLENQDFGGNLMHLLRKNLKSNNGEIQLNKVLPDL